MITIHKPARQQKSSRLELKNFVRGPLPNTKIDNRQLEVLRLLALTVHQHPWTFATVDVVARSAIGAGWKIVPVETYKSLATERNRKRVFEFLESEKRRWNNIKDYLDLPAKLSQTIASYRLFGQASWELIRNEKGLIGFDVLSGVTVPNVDDAGFFKEPAFIHYPWDGSKEIEYGINEIAYFFNPGSTGRIIGESAYEPLVDVSLPADLFAALSYRSMFENINTPYNGVWNVDQNVTDEDFELFVSLLQERYTGPENYGKNPLVIRGAAEFKELQNKRKDDAPYLEGRQYNREEVFGVTGVAGSKLGLSSDFNKANIRETRREFHESVLRPIFQIIEQGIYHQVFSREMGIKGWMLVFNRPDITTSLEQASIDMRYLQWGVYSPNEIRKQKGEAPRDDGDEYYIPSMSTGDTPEQNEPKSGQQGQKEIPEDENPDSATDPIPVERPPRDEATTSNSYLKARELKNWRRIVLEYMDNKRSSKEFTPKHISANLYDSVMELLESGDNNFDDVKKIFDAAIEVSANE